ncbi:unknown (plasmid) [Haloarcula marismortui ATCC 43049]|uniref:Uncharacterized protein n=1 Tax=Haloarcula marismortui (strain ATCC 43049 / DSM 3752 / JCM 8966 / VKM B-1809) TaxID=272569 RepID=Q5V7K3_HALMA|nr:unknown [Haloarcula marismortui ATCC 43049]
MSPPYRYLIIFELIYQRAPERSVEHPRAFEDWSISVTVVAVVLPVVLPMGSGESRDCVGFDR